MCTFRVLFLAGLLNAIVVHLAAASPISELIKAGGRAVISRGGGAAARQTAKQVARQAASHTAKNAATTAAQARAVVAIRHFSDDAARLADKAAGNAPAYADDLAKVSQSLNPRNHRRLMMLAPELKQSGKAAAVIRNLAKSNNVDEAVEALWRHRGKLAAITAVTVAAVHADDLAKAGGQFVAKPLIEHSIRHVVRPIALILTTLFVVVGGLLLIFNLDSAKHHAKRLLYLCGSWPQASSEIDAPRTTIRHPTTNHGD